MTETQSLPASLDAEKMILGVALLDESGEAFQQAAAVLQPGDFYHDWNRKIFGAMLEVSNSGKPMDLVPLTEALLQHKELEAIGGVAYLSSLTDGTPIVKNLGTYCSILREKSLLRQVIHSCNAAVGRAMETGAKPEDAMQVVQDAILAIEASSSKTHARQIGVIVEEAVRQLERQAQNKGLVGYTTGIPGLDRATTGLRRGEMWVIGALPNRGKSPLALQILRANAKLSVPGVLFSLEMSQFQTACRLLAGESTVSAWKLRDPKTIGEGPNWLPLYEAAASVKDWPMWIDDADSLSLSELTARARLYIRRYKVEIIAVDYLMLVDAPGRELRHQADAVVKAMRSLAKSENVAVVLLSQFRRPPDENDIPNMGWFKESGGIEANAHVALAIHRPIGEDRRFTGEDQILIVKQRDGAMGSIAAWLDPSRLEFKDRLEEK